MMSSMLTDSAIQTIGDVNCMHSTAQEKPEREQVHALDDEALAGMECCAEY